MFKRLTCLLLMPCLLLTRSAALGHVHVDGQPAGHEQRPHVHTNKHDSTHHHPYHHHGHTHHPHDSDGHEHESTSPQQRQSKTPADSGHDSDAIFVDQVDVTVGERPVSASEPEVLPLWFDPALSQAAGILSSSLCGGGVLRQLHSPPQGQCACAIYILQAALLI